MARRTCLHVLLLVLSVGFAPIAQAERTADQPAPGKFAVQEIEHGGLVRTYYLRLPAGYGGAGPYPVLFVLHGGGGSAQVMMNLWGRGFHERADGQGMILVYPEGIPDQAGSTKHHWNDGRRFQTWAAHRLDVDDVGFISKVIDQVISQYRGDPGRIFVTGASNGGLMCYRLACELSEKVRAIAALIANLQPELAECTPAKPISVLIMNGTEDPLMPYQGGEITFGRVKLGQVLSAAETVKFWVARGRLPDRPEMTLEPDKDPKDGTRVRRESYSAESSPIQVVFYTIEGGGHTIPGGLQYLPEKVIGRTSRDLDAGEVIINFFLSQRKR